MEQIYFRKGFGLKTRVQPVIDAIIHNPHVPRRMCEMGIRYGADAVEVACTGGDTARGPDGFRLAGSEQVAP